MLFCFLVIISNQIAAQKELSAAQMLKGQTNGLLQPMPRIINWLDDENIFLVKQGQGKSLDTILMNVKTGSTKYQKPITKADTYIQEGDIMYADALGNIVALTNTQEKEQNPTLSPDGNKIAFTRAGNLYAMSIADKTEKQISFDGSATIYNGYASWIYYEEILGRISNYCAFWWSPDSKSIAYMHFDDSNVPIFPIYNSTGVHGFTEETRYPKAGDANPTVKMGVYSFATQNTNWLAFDEQVDHYIGMPFWMPDSRELCMQWMNRSQDSLLLYAADINTGNKKIIYTEYQKTWVEWKEWLHFYNNHEFLLLSDVSGWKHIYHYNTILKTAKALTSGNWQVKEVIKTDDSNQQIWFTARKDNSTRTDLMTIKKDGSGLKQLTTGSYTHQVNISPSGKYFIDNFSNVSSPETMSIFHADGTFTRNIATEKGADFDTYTMAKTELLRIPSGDGFDLPVLITWPLNFDSTKKYPVWVSIYGGPDAGTVYDGFKGIGQNQWWAKEGLIQIAIDHRGSGHFGKVGMNYMHRNLGNWEIKDYSTVVQWFIEKGIADPARIGINGFSYGGYITCLALTKASQIFKYGIAGGSVTDWQLYDSHYTERYMDAPTENKEGYEAGSILKYVPNYNSGLYIIHGTMDDNVHLQNSIQLIEALQQEGKQFDMMFYPGGRHGWRKLKGQWQHYQVERTKFIYLHLLQKPMPEELAK